MSPAATHTTRGLDASAALQFTAACTVKKGVALLLATAVASFPPSATCTHAQPPSMIPSQLSSAPMHLSAGFGRASCVHRTGAPPAHDETVFWHALQVNPDASEIKVKSGDVFLLCSDGLTGMVPEDEILRIVTETEKLEDACQKLIDAANERGGLDNVTAILVKTT